jgi:hypothetical protein
MNDPVYHAFLKRQYESGMALARASDVVNLIPLHGWPPDFYLAHFTCRGLVQTAPGQIREAESFAVGIRFPRDYLRQAVPKEVLSWVSPLDVFHPNILGWPPAICVGRLMRGTPLVDLLYQVFDLITWRKVTMREDDALNRAACEWARANRERFPVDSRPLKRHRLRLDVTVRTGGTSV